MATVTEVLQKAAAKLGFKQGEDLPASLNEDLQNGYDEAYEELEELDLVTWSQTGTVPNNVSDYLADIIAWKRGDVYATPEIMQNVSARYVMAERNIKRGLTPRYRSTSEKEDF